MINLFNKFQVKKNYDQLIENINDQEKKEILNTIFINNSQDIKSNMFKDLEILKTEMDMNLYQFIQN